MHHDDHMVTCLTEEQVQALPELVYKRKPMEGVDARSDDVDGADAGSPVNDTKSEPFNVNNTDDKKNTENVEKDPQKDYTRGMAHSKTVHELSDKYWFSTCSMCSICSTCLEEFEEAIAILPMCNHGFHFECIKPWLTERQSYCP